MGIFDTWVAEHGYSNPFGGGGTDANGFPVNPSNGQVVRLVNDWGQGETWQYQAGTTDNFGNVTGTEGWKRLGVTDISTGGAGATWRPGEYGLEQQNQEMLQQHYYISDAISKLTEDRAKLEGEWTMAYNQDNLALMREVESRTAANQAQELALKQQLQSIDSAIGQANAATNVYQTQTQGRSSQLATMADLTKAAAEAQANPWNPLGYLDFAAGAGGATPFSNMTPEQNTGYGNQMAQNWQNTFGPVAGQINQSLAATYQTPDAITAAMQQMQPWYMGSSNYNAASPNQQAIFKSLQPSQQTALAAATPEQMAALARMGQPAVNPALARYQTSTAGEKAALAGATPEQLRILWERGQVR